MVTDPSTKTKKIRRRRIIGTLSDEQMCELWTQGHTMKEVAKLAGLPDRKGIENTVYARIRNLPRYHEYRKTAPKYEIRGRNRIPIDMDRAFELLMTGLTIKEASVTMGIDYHVLYHRIKQHPKILYAMQNAAVQTPGIALRRILRSNRSEKQGPFMAMTG